MRARTSASDATISPSTSASSTLAGHAREGRWTRGGAAGFAEARALELAGGAATDALLDAGAVDADCDVLAALVTPAGSWLVGAAGATLDAEGAGDGAGVSRRTAGPHAAQTSTTSDA